jgi:hypothetical protein
MRRRSRGKEGELPKNEGSDTRVWDDEAVAEHLADIGKQVLRARGWIWSKEASMTVFVIRC